MRATLSYGSPRKERTQTGTAFLAASFNEILYFRYNFPESYTVSKKYMSLANFGGREGGGPTLEIRAQFDRHLFVTQSGNIAS